MQFKHNHSLDYQPPWKYFKDDKTENYFIGKLETSMSKETGSGTAQIGNSSSTPVSVSTTGTAPTHLTAQSSVPVAMQQPNLARPAQLTHSDGVPPIINIPAMISMPQTCVAIAEVVPVVAMVGAVKTQTTEPVCKTTGTM